MLSIKRNRTFLHFSVFFFNLFFINTLKSQSLPVLQGLQLWLRADTLVNALSDSVIEWNDASGNGKKAVQADLVKSPLQINSIPELDYLPVIRFDGTNDFLLVDSTVTIGTAFIVSNWRGGGVNFPNYNGIINRAAALSPAYMFIGTANSTNFYTSSTVFETNIYKNSQLSIDYEPLAVYKIICGITNNPVNNYSCVIGNNPWDAGNNFWNGDIAEIIFYDYALTATEQNQVEQYFRFKYASPVNLSPDIAMPSICDTILDAGARFTKFQWNDSLTDTLQTFTVTKPGTYFVKATDIFGYDSYDTVVVTYPFNQITTSDTICLGDTLIWNTQLNTNDYTFQWSDSSNDSLLNITTAGTYSVTVTDTTMNCQYISDVVTVFVDSFPIKADLGADDSLCEGNSIALIQGQNEAGSYLWSDSSTDSSLVINNSGIYSVSITSNNGCNSRDSITITIVGAAPTMNFSATDVCWGNTTPFTDLSSTSDTIISWNWNFGDNNADTIKNPNHTYLSADTFIVSLTVQTNVGCFNSQSDTVIVYPLPSADFTYTAGSLNTSVQFTDLTNDFGYGINNWFWDFGDSTNAIIQHPAHQYSASGSFIVELKATSANGCVDSIAKEINIYDTLPYDISGLAIWYSGDGEKILNENNMLQWADASANLIHATQSDTDFQPTLIPFVSILNNKPVVRFNGINNFLSINSPVNIGSVFIVSNWQGNNDSFPNYNGLITKATSTAKPYVLITNAGTDNFYTPAGVTIFQSNIFKNGQSSISYSPLNQYKITSAIADNTYSDYNLVIGKNPLDGGNTHWDGDIAEIIIYSVSLTSSQRQQVEQYLRYKYAPPVNLGPDISMSTLCSDTLFAESRFIFYKWNNNPNDTNQTFIFTKPGKYFVDVVDIFGFTSSDTVIVNYPFNQIETADTICLADTLIWNTQLNKNIYDFQWSNSSNDSLLNITVAGIYSVTVTDSAAGCQYISDSVIVLVDSFPAIVNLGPPADSLCSGNTIALFLGQTEATSYLWSDSSTNNSLIINSSGTYSLTVTNSNNCTAIDSINITITGNAPTVNFSATEICLGIPTQFLDSSTSADSVISWNWNFGDGNADTINKNPNHSYISSDTFIVSLTVQTDAGCSNSKSDTVIVHPLPQANFNVANQILCSKDSVSFNDNSSNPEGNLGSWLWNFDDDYSGSNNTSSLQSPSHSFSDSGNYGVSLIIENSFGCIDTVIKNVYIWQKPIADFNFVSGCEDSPTKFFDNSLGFVDDWQWDFGDNNGSGQANPENIYDTAGKYFVSLLATTLMGCADTVSDSVTVYNNPVANFFTADFCRGTPIQAIDSSTITNSNIVTWNWNVQGANLSSIQQNPYFTFNNSSQNEYLMVLKVSTAQGCNHETAKLIKIHNAPSADFSFLSTYGEVPLPVSFFNNSDDSAVSYSWNFGDGDSSNSENPVHTFTDSGDFQVQLIAYTQYGCTDTAMKKIKIRKQILDIAVTRVRTNNTNNFMTVSADLYNVGNIGINNFEIVGELSNRPAIKESWSGLLDENGDFTYTFNASFEISDNTMPDAVCVRVEKPNSLEDANQENNEMCISFSEFKILSIFPNPAGKEIIIEYTLTGEAENLEIIIYDEVGKKVDELKSQSGKKGLHKTSLDISNLSHGIYALKMVYGEKYEVKRIMKY